MHIIRSLWGTYSCTKIFETHFLFNKKQSMFSITIQWLQVHLLSHATTGCTKPSYHSFVHNLSLEHVISFLSLKDFCQFPSQVYTKSEVLELKSLSLLSQLSRMYSTTSKVQIIHFSRKTCMQTCICTHTPLFCASPVSNFSCLGFPNLGFSLCTWQMPSPQVLQSTEKTGSRTRF